MIKLFGVFAVGMFVGAVCVEILARTKPELVDAIGGKAEETVNAFRSELEDENEPGAVIC